MMYPKVLISIVILSSASNCMTAIQLNKNEFVNRNVDRNVDISTQLAKISSKVTLENVGKQPLKAFIFALELEILGNLSFLGAQNADSSKASLRISKVIIKGHEDKSLWNIELKEPLLPGKTTTVEVETIFTHLLVPHPAQITQKEKQLVYYNGNHHYYSPYATMKQTTTVTLSSRNIENYSKLKPVSQSDNIITYGPYENVASFSVDKMVIHYENNSPFLTITSIQRYIEVSHWGNIAVEETLDLMHGGAILKGPFSRYEYQRESQSGLASIKAFKTILPAAAADVYYRDDIGNISTSHMKVLSDSVELDLRPRFPLFGGWKTHYVIGYNVPSYEYLYNLGDAYVLKMRLLDHVFDDMVVDELFTHIILPEGAHNIKLTTPYKVERLADELHYTYLDTQGRPVITMKKTNLVENHIQDFELHYNFKRYLMLHEPLLVVMAIYLLFLIVIIYVRMDFSFNKEEAGEPTTRPSVYREKVVSHQVRRTALFTQIEELLGKLKATRDLGSFHASLKAVQQEYKAETHQINELVNKLKTDNPEVAEKVIELQKLDKHLRDIYVQHQSLYVDKYLPSKINAKQCLEGEYLLHKKKEECVDKINAIVKSIA